MTQGRPRQFFDEVADRNARLAIGSPGDLCHAINAIMTLDALFGILHAALHDEGFVSEPRDDQWKDDLANQSAEYRLLRDTAFALKHGKLRGKKPRIVRRPDQLFKMPGGFDPAAFAPAAFDTEKVWIETEGTDYRAYEVIEKVAELARSELNRHGM
jgi:hypothetical protein